MFFPKALLQNEKQSALFKIWNRILNSISNDNNLYAKQTSSNFICINIFVKNCSIFAVKYQNAKEILFLYIYVHFQFKNSRHRVFLHNNF